MFMKLFSGLLLLVTEQARRFGKHFDLNPRSECCFHPIDLVCSEIKNDKIADPFLLPCRN